MLSKPVYEALPYGCLILGSVSLISFLNIVAVVAGISLYALGAIIWLMRFRYRYPVPKKFIRRGRTLPEDLYEFKPFILFVPLMFMLAIGDESWCMGLSVALAYHGFSILRSRISFRRKYAI